MEVAVTVEVCGPMTEVSRCPLPPRAVLVPAESAQDASPNPPAPSAQQKLVGTACPTV